MHDVVLPVPKLMILAGVRLAVELLGNIVSASHFGV